MSLFTLLLTLVRELAPFLKEALLEGQTFRAWLRYNWLTFAWLVNTLAMTLMVAFLSDHLTNARIEAYKTSQQLKTLQESGQLVLTRYQRMQKQNESLLKANEQLAADNAVQAEKIEAYETYLGRCGVNVQTGQCPSPREKPIQRPKPRKTKVNPPKQEEEQPGFFQRLRDKLTRKKETS